MEACFEGPLTIADDFPSPTPPKAFTALYPGIQTAIGSQHASSQPHSLTLPILRSYLRKVQDYIETLEYNFIGDEFSEEIHVRRCCCRYFYYEPRLTLIAVLRLHQHLTVSSTYLFMFSFIERTTLTAATPLVYLLSISLINLSIPFSAANENAPLDPRL